MTQGPDKPLVTTDGIDPNRVSVASRDGNGASGTLVLHNVTAGYGDLQVLRGVSCTLRPGELVVLAGPNGAGKTTLLSTIIGTVKGWSGSVRVGDHEVMGKPIYRRTRLGLGLVPEGRGLFPSLTVWENLRVAVKAARLNREPRLS